MSYVDRDLARWRPRSRPRLRLLARWLRHTADRICPEPRSTIVVRLGEQETTFIDCVEIERDSMMRDVDRERRRTRYGEQR